MTKYLISLGAHAMDHIPEDDMPAVAKAAHAAASRPRRARYAVPAGATSRWHQA